MNIGVFFIIKCSQQNILAQPEACKIGLFALNATKLKFGLIGIMPTRECSGRNSKINALNFVSLQEWN